MVDAPTHVLATPEKSAMRQRNGDIVAVYDTEADATFALGNWNWNEPISSPRSDFIHIINFPANLLPKSYRLAGMIRITRDVLRLSQYRIPEGVLPIIFQDELDADREVTISWGVIKASIRKKIIVDILDPLQDDETTAIVDGDLL